MPPSVDPDSERGATEALVSQEGRVASPAGGGGLLALRMVQYFLVFVAGLVVTRALGPELRAQYALPLMLGYVAWGIVNLSLDVAAGRLLARREASLAELVRVLSLATLGLGALGATITIGFGLVVRETLLSNATSSAILLAGAQVPALLGVQVTTGLLVRIGELRSYGWASAFSGAVLLALVGYLALTGSVTPARAIAAVDVAMALFIVVTCVVLTRYSGARSLIPRPSRRIAAATLRAGIGLHVATIAMLLNLRLDLFIVSAMTNARQTGLYSLSTTLAELIFLAAWTLVQSAARTQTEAEPDVAARYTLDFVSRSWTLVLVGAGMCAAGAYPAILLVYGREWTGSVLPFVILAFAAVAFSIEMPVRVLLARVARPTVILVPALTGMVVNVGLNVALIPLLGIVGAALASLVSYWLYAVLLLIRFQRATGLEIRSAFSHLTHDTMLVRGVRWGVSRLPATRR